MTNHINTLIAIPELTTGRRIFALNQCLTTAQSMSVTEEMTTEIKNAIAADSQTISLEWAWIRAKKSSDARGGAMVTDRKIDRIYSAIYRKITDNIDVLPPGHTAVAPSKRLDEQVFPDGVAAITSLPFEDQLALNSAVIKRFEGDLKDEVAGANIGEYVNELKKQNSIFAEELNKPSVKEIDYKAIVVARAAGNLSLRTIVAMILSEFRNDEESQALLLTPILEQVERIQKLRKGRRNPTDVDPETGEEIPDTEDDDIADELQVG